MLERYLLGTPQQSSGQDSALSLPRARVPSLVREIRPYKLHGVAKNKTKQNPPEQKLHMHITVKYIPYKTFPPKQKCQKENKDESFKVNHKFVF